MIFTVGGIKGGTGKTTVATNFVVWLARLGFDILMIDADDQETATDFTAWREKTLNGQGVGYTAVKITGENLHGQVKLLKRKYDHIIIDVGGRDTTSQRAALAASDCIILPFQPRMADFWTVTKVCSLLAGIGAVRGNKLQAFAFLNRADPSGSDNIECAKALKATEGIKFIDHSLGNRKAFANAMGQGLSALELTPQDEKATTELNELFASLLKTKK